MSDLIQLFHTMVESGASDLHLAVGSVPMARVDSRLEPMAGWEPLTPEKVEELLRPHLDAEQWQTLQTSRELDCSMSVAGLSRFRANALWQRGTLGAVFRAVASHPKSIEELGLPDSLRRLGDHNKGLVLVTGPTGSGKSSTLAALIRHINETQPLHVVTIEDPIEFLHRNERCIIRQRELGTDTLSFAAALKHVLRQDPDVILVGEMRDLETISLAVSAAETGHLVLGTLHTTSAASTVDRIIDVYPTAQQPQIRTQLAATLQGILSQTLVPKVGGSGRACALEILIGTHAIRNLIREGKTHQIGNMMQAGGATGMVTLNQALAKLVTDGTVTLEAALERSNEPEGLKALVGTHVRARPAPNGRGLAIRAGAAPRMTGR